MKSPNWHNLAREACTQQSISASNAELIATWDERGCANAVYRTEGDRFLKVFGPEAEWQFYVERSVLSLLSAQREIPAPRLLSEGRLDDGYPFLFLAEVAGSTAEEIWASLPRPEQMRIARDLGGATKAIHELPKEELVNIEKRFGGMKEHNKRYRDGHVADILASESVSASQREELLRFINEEAPKHLDEKKVVTHFDMAHNHIYLEWSGSTIRISGIIDWAEATIGPAEWDLAYLWFWTFSGDREAMRACLMAYFGNREPPPRFAVRCLAATFYTSSMALLWPKFLEHGPGQGAIVTELAQSLFPQELFGDPW